LYVNTEGPDAPTAPFGVKVKLVKLYNPEFAVFVEVTVTDVPVVYAIPDVTVVLTDPPCVGVNTTDDVV